MRAPRRGVSCSGLDTAAGRCVPERVIEQIAKHLLYAVEIRQHYHAFRRLNVEINSAIFGAQGEHIADVGK